MAQRPGRVEMGAPAGGGQMTAKVVGGARWSLLTNVGAQAVQFVSSVVLARLLSPAAFGLIATIWIFSGFAIVVFQFGLGQALIHIREPSERHRATVFWVNALSGAVYFVTMCALGPALQDFFDAPGLTAVLWVVASSFLLNLTPVQYSMLQKAFRFRAIALIQLSSAILGQAVAICVATVDKGAIAIAIAYPITAIVSTVLFFLRVRWVPKHFIDRQSLRELWAFSGGLLGSQIVAYWSRNVDNLVIGRGLGPVPLALYNRAFNLMALPVTQVGQALTVVLFPALSSIRGEPERLRSAQLRSSRLIAFLLFPVVTCIAVAAPAIVATLWGPKWSAVAPLLEILAFTGLPRIMCITSNWLLQARGRTKTVMGTNTIIMILTTLGALLGLHWGAAGVAVGVLVANVVATPFVVTRAVSGTRLSIRDIAANFTPAVVSSAVMWAAAEAAPRLLSMDDTRFETLLVQIGVGAIAYVLSALLIDRTTLSTTMLLLRRSNSGPGLGSAVPEG